MVLRHVKDTTGYIYVHQRIVRLYNSYVILPCTIIHVPKIFRLFSEVSQLGQISIVVLEVVEYTHDGTVLVVRFERFEADVLQCDVLHGAIRELVRDCHIDEVFLKME